ncbi:helix-turn-helix domain-containing protein [Sphingomonas panacis]|uniref:helix-turn-helix domain-containing protein n=1 Tax=Sphingomonas panacis TaxID=1560345 RepID=UPI001F0A4594|nr:helix-turn-helix transcriptional regulator [Sphingomonas panacis]
MTYSSSPCRPRRAVVPILAANIRRYRKERGVSQQDFAYDIEMDRTYFGGIERGERNVPIDNIERIANGLGISADSLLIESGEDPEGISVPVPEG